MEKAKFELTQFLKNNAWGLIVAIVVVISNFTLMASRADLAAKTISDHEQRIRNIELKQEMIIERLNNINEDTRFLREQVEKREK